MAAYVHAAADAMRPIKDSTPPEAPPARGQRENQDGWLVQCARCGDVGGYEELMRRYERKAFHLALLITCNREDAEEATQDAFLKAFNALDQFRRDAPFKPWLMRIVINTAKDRRRSSLRHRSLARLSIEHQTLLGRLSSSVEGDVVWAEQQRALAEAIDSLPEKQRHVVVCRYLLELSEEETAITLGTPIGTVKSRLARALDKLELALVEVHPGP